VLKKIIKYFFITIFTVVIIYFIAFIKPTISFMIESYTSNLLEQKVKISSFNLTDFSIEAYIQNQQNKIDAKLITLFPLKIEATFSGDIDVFKKYHSLKGDIKADANITYDGKLIVEAKGTLFDAKIEVRVEELVDDWFVRVDAKNLNIDEFKKQNSLEFALDGVVDFELNKKSKNFTLSGLLKSSTLATVELDAKGEFENEKISASCSLTQAEKKLHLEKLLFNFKTNQVSVSTKEFGGDLNLALEDKKLSLDAKALHLEKLLAFIDYKEIINGVIDIKGEFDTKSKKSNLLLSSPTLSGFEQELKDITLSIPALQFLDKTLSFTYTLDATFLKKPFSLDGNLSYKDTLHIVALSNDFKSKSHFELNDEEIKVSIKRLDIKELLEFLKQEPLASGHIDLDAKGNFDKLIFAINSDVKLNELDAKIHTDGFFITDTKEINAKFKLSTKLGKEDIKIKGNASYKKEFRIDASSSSFGAKNNLILRADKFEFYTKNLDMQKLSKAFDKLKLPFGKIDFFAKGDFKNIALNIRSKELRRNLNLENADDYISFDLSGTYKDDILSIKDEINLHYKRKKLPLNVDATISLIPPYNSKGSLVHKENNIIVKSFSFEDEQIKANFEVNINELFLYKAAFSRPLYGSLHIQASHSDILHINTKSFGGELDVTLDKSHILVNIDKVQANKVAYLFDKNSSIESGIIDGIANYEIKQKKATTEIVVKDAIIRGVDIDKKLEGIDDLLGLNVVNMSKSIISHYFNEKKRVSKISQLQLDLSLEDNNIKLDDIAIRTREFLIVVQGNLKDNGDIKKLDVSIVDKNGCAIVTQALSGNIKEPKIANTTSNLVNIVQGVPTSILKTANKIIHFGTESVDGIASFGFNKIFRSDANISITSDLVSKSRSIIQFGSDMIMPSGCKVIYSGKVMHPANSKKDSK